LSDTADLLLSSSFAPPLDESIILLPSLFAPSLLLSGTNSSLSFSKCWLLNQSYSDLKVILSPALPYPEIADISTIPKA
jgi:hypothetical protein